MKIRPKNKRQLLKAALGEIPSDLLIKNVKLVNTITGEIYPANVFVYDGMIAHVEYQNLEADLDKAAEVIDGQGQYLLPGFIDAHEHIESSMMTPRNFARTVIPHGTTTVITDPRGSSSIFQAACRQSRALRTPGQSLAWRRLKNWLSFPGSSAWRR